LQVLPIDQELSHFALSFFLSDFQLFADALDYRVVHLSRHVPRVAAHVQISVTVQKKMDEIFSVSANIVLHVAEAGLSGVLIAREAGKKLAQDAVRHERFKVRPEKKQGFFFNACILRYYLSKPLTILSCSLNAVFPCLKLRLR
jgi:hypothetical protein